MQVPEVKYIGPKSDYSEKIIYSTVEECYEYCKDKKELSIDIETSYRYPKGTYKNENIYKPGLDPYLSVICMLQLGDEHTIFVIDVRVVEITLLLPLFKDKEKVFIGHNLKFEQKHLLHNYGILFHTIYDTMIVEQNLTNGLGWSKENPTGLLYSLEALAGRYLGIKPAVSIDLFTEINEDDEQDYIDKSIRMGFLTIGNKPFTEAQILYGSDDILYPILIKKKQAAGYNGYNPKHVHLLENKFCLVLADIEYKGMEFDKEQWTRVYQQKLIQYKHRLKKLNDYVEANYKMFCNPPDLFEPRYICSIEWGSSQQVVKLFKHIGICPMEKSKQTRKMEYTVGAATLVKQLPNDYKEKYNNDEETEIVEDKDLILNYLLLKVSEQCCTTFGEEWLKYIHPITGRVHSSYKQLLNTGRMCVDVSTLIDTSIGYIPIGNIIPKVENTVMEWKSGLKVRTHTGEYQLVTHTMNKGKEVMYKVTLESGHTITCTKKHKFLTEKGWYSLEDILSSPTEYPILYDESY